MHFYRLMTSQEREYNYGGCKTCMSEYYMRVQNAYWMSFNHEDMSKP